MTQLAKLATPFPPRFVQHIQGNDYVAHHDVNQWLLGIVGPFDFALTEIVRGDVPGAPPDPNGNSRRAKAGTPDLRGVVVAAVYRLGVTIDGRKTVVDEIGECGDPHNWAHDGQRLKDAASDALKRCAMRIGLGLHLWAQGNYVLDQRLNQPAQGNGQAAGTAAREAQGAA